MAIGLVPALLGTPPVAARPAAIAAAWDEAAAALDTKPARPGPETPAEAKPAVDPWAFPVRRAVEALDDPGRELPRSASDPCPPPEQRKLPCFPALVEAQGQTPEQKLARFFKDFEPLYGPAAPGSSSTHREVLRYSNLPPIQGMDWLGVILAVSQWVASKLKGKTAPVYFVYVVTEGERAWAELREGRVPPQIAYGRPGRVYHEVAGLGDLGSAEAAYERLEDALTLEAEKKQQTSPASGAPVSR